MANTGAVQVNVAVLNDGTAVVNGTGAGTPTTTFTECHEALLILACSAVNGAGVFVPKLQGSTDGTTYVDLTATTGVALTAVSATGLAIYRYRQLPPKVRVHFTKSSGTSVAVVALIVGLIPTDSVNATDV